MKKNLIFASLLVAALFIGKPAFALNCATVQGPGTPEACYTEVTISSVEATLVSAGTALVWDSDSTTPAQGGYQVRTSRASSDNNIIAGFAQRRFVTGETGFILVKGWGFVRPVGGIATGDNLFVAASGDVAAFTGPQTSTYSSAEPVAVAFQTSSSNGNSARYAYIKV